jgi:hypothetical protein
MSAPQRNIVWIASYPKSGNTWMRFMLCSLLYGELHTAEALNRLAPDIHEAGNALDVTVSGMLVKTHFIYSAKLPFVDRTSAAIYVVRDPIDVFSSNFHYYQRRMGGGSDSGAVLDQYFDTFLQNRGDPRWRDFGMGTWDENVRSWIEPQPFPVVCVKYEDMVANPRRTCEMLAKLCRPGSTANDIERAVLNSSFERMRRIEAEDIRAKRVGIFYKPYLQPSIDAGVRFMRSGGVGGGSASLNPDQRSRLR